MTDLDDAFMRKLEERLELVTHDVGVLFADGRAAPCEVVADFIAFAADDIKWQLMERGWTASQ